MTNTFYIRYFMLICKASAWGPVFSREIFNFKSVFRLFPGILEQMPTSANNAYFVSFYCSFSKSQILGGGAIAPSAPPVPTAMQEYSNIIAKWAKGGDFAFR